MTNLHIHLLGDFQLLVHDQPLVSIYEARLQSLLAYLVLHRHAPQPRQRLAFLFWPDSSETQAYSNLRKNLHLLRHLIPDVDHFLKSDTKTIQWQADAPFVLDVAEFEQALVAATQAEKNNDLALVQFHLTAAIDLYTGDLLPGCYDDWILPERERLRESVLSALSHLIALFEQQRAYVAAIRYANHLLRVDPLHEETYRCLIRLHTLNNDRSAALRIYHTCATTLQRELGVEPSSQTQEAYERLLKREMPTLPLRRLEDGVRNDLIGRSMEWPKLLAVWQAAEKGNAHFTLISGEAGIGKTRLAEELFHWVNQQGIAVARTRSYAAEGALAYAPGIEWLRTAALRSHWQKLDVVWRSELARLLPEILTEQREVPTPEPMVDSWQRQRLFEALARAVLSSAHPLLLVLDDVQWCDTETLAWLHYLLRYDPKARLLIVGTVRPEEVTSDHPLTTLLLALRSAGQVTEFELGPLDTTETLTLATQVAGYELDAATAQQLYQATEGNPLFVVETVRAARSEGRRGEQHALPPSPPFSPTLLPPKVHAVIQRRLHQLSSTARELASLAAVIGRSFTVAVLAHASGLAEDALVRGLDELWQRRIVREQGVETYDFSHDRIREVAYAAVSTLRRRLLHKQVAQTLTVLYPDQLDALQGQLGRHAEQAGQWAVAIQHYRQAAVGARGLYAFAQALAYLNRTLTLLEKLPATVAQQQQRIECWLEQGRIMIYTHGWTSGERFQILERANALSKHLENPLYRYAALQGLRDYYGNIGDWRTAYLMAQEQVQTAEKLQDRQRQCSAYQSLGNTYQHRGEFLASLTCYKKVLEFEEELGPTYPRGVSAHIRMAEALWFCGYPAQAQHMALATIGMADEQKHPHGRVHGREFAIYIGQRSGNEALVRQITAESLALCEQFGFPNYAQAAQALAGWALVQAGGVQAGLHQIAQAIATMDQIGDRFIRPYFLSLLAHAQSQNGQLQTAWQTLATAQQVCEALGDYQWQAEVVRMTGNVGERLQHGAMAVEALYVSALNIARQQGAKSLELRAATSLARLWQTQGKRAEAHQILKEIYAWFTEGFDTPDLQAAKALLIELGR